jgi:hypothetical protein
MLMPYRDIKNPDAVTRDAGFAAADSPRFRDPFGH